MKRNRKLLAAFLLLGSVLLPGQITAQLCQGSLGEPIQNITFGSGPADPEPGAINTNYKYVRSSGPNDGYYTILDATCCGGTWFQLKEDHTPGDANGYMVLFNSSYDPGIFHQDTLTGLCENTTFEFAAWILNLMVDDGGIEPNITFTLEALDGTILQTYQTGDIHSGPLPEWRQFGMLFTTTAGITSVVVKMVNNAPGGGGNDFLLDDITLRPCGPSVAVSIDGYSDAVSICKGDPSSFTFTGTVANSTNPSLQWQVSTDAGVSWTDIAGANNYTYLRAPTATPGIYQYRLVVMKTNVFCGRTMSGILTITVEALPIPAASNNGPLCEGDDLMLKASNGNNIYSWTGPQNFTSNAASPSIANVNTAHSGKYYVQVTSTSMAACTTIDSTEALVLPTPVVNAGVDSAICEGETIRLMGSGSNVSRYSWSPLATLSNPGIPDPVASPKETTLYVLKGSLGGCQVTDTVKIFVNKRPSADAGPDQMIAKGETTVLNGKAAGTDLSYQWTPEADLSAPSSLITTARPIAQTTYVLDVRSNVKCGRAKDSLTVSIFTGIYVPNAFTPDDDGLNDTWRVNSLRMFPNAEVKVFNRWGQVVYSSKGSAVNWDGKYKGILQPIGGFSYFIDLKNGKRILRGTIMLIR